MHIKWCEYPVNKKLTNGIVTVIEIDCMLVEFSCQCKNFK